MSTIIGQSQRSVAELMQLTSYSEMSDDEIERIIDFKVTLALEEQKAALIDEQTNKRTEQILSEGAELCKQNRDMLQCMCEQKVEPISLVINKLEFHPMEFSHE